MNTADAVVSIYECAWVLFQYGLAPLLPGLIRLAIKQPSDVKHVSFKARCTIMRLKDNVRWFHDPEKDVKNILRSFMDQ